ncbi:MAG TPA: FAD-binding oxidoreductase [Vitreimonas sp.]|nr:FAD-binding oxidoreductase [Vitreimonas sp.]
MQPPQLGTVKLIDKLVHNEKFTQYYFEYLQPASMNFKAGQYMSIQVTDRGDRRSYSICSSPAKTHGFELLVDSTPHGLGVTYLENLPLGGEMKSLGPLGVFTMSEVGDEEAVVYVAAGSGITPFRSMIFDQLQNKQDQRPMYLYWGLRYAETMFWQDEFQELAQNFPNFHFHPVISRALPEWPLCRGRVTDCLNVHALPEKAGFYLCGNAAMIHDTSALLQQKGVTPEHIHHEKFF